ncbi:protein dehydratase (plasmid) [Pseudorhodobacter turbinis]|uniref:Protein dehydratase n=1 Tax=Pseudorhodobacter turbinis TaxID=2500533 RepID=A0A4P8ELG1_9RHOB|nr:MaoC family dehydratase N-terminal domain-containing protein [Pseudorhodobacter turbinis]QCO57732.1 protein dehydratase [Pseudorhodobacter turbinis]
MSLDIDHLRQWIGREDQAHEVLSSTLAQRLYATLDREGPTEDGADAPLLTHHCLCQPLVSTAELGPDGHPKRGGFLPPVPLPRRMWAGGALQFHSAPRVGEDITRQSVIEDVTMKSGRSGALCFVAVRHNFSSPRGPILSERQDIVYREATPSGTAAKPTPAPHGEERREISASPAFLFRYSALTFNSHRIHYDLPYAMDEEFYPGLVVHGPLQAMLLAQYAADLMGRTPSSFSFRSMAPIFGGGSFFLHAQKQGDDLKLWTAAPDGPMAMEAQARWD